MLKKILTFLAHHWENGILATTLLLLGLFLLGKDWFGLNGILASFLALIGTLTTALLTFLSATVIIPLAALLTGAAMALLAALTTLAAFFIGGIITPVAAFFTGLATSILTWLWGTWLGTLLSPLYSLLAPLVVKIGPWITLTKTGHKFYDWLDDQPWFPRWAVLTSHRAPDRTQMRSNASPKHHNAPPKHHSRATATPARTRRSQSK